MPPEPIELGCDFPDLELEDRSTTPGLLRSAGAHRFLRFFAIEYHLSYILAPKEAVTSSPQGDSRLTIAPRTKLSALARQAVNAWGGAPAAVGACTSISTITGRVPAEGTANRGVPYSKG